MARKRIKTSGLGMGLDALIKSKTRSPEEPKENLQIKEENRTDINKDNEKIQNSSSAQSIDSQNLKQVTNQVKKNPRITLWSARSAAVLRYLKKTQPEFSISKVASELIEEAVQEKYPEIWELFKDL